MVFDSACGFWNSSRCLVEKIEYVIKEVSSMKLFAVKLLNATSVTDFSIEGICSCIMFLVMHRVKKCSNLYILTIALQSLRKLLVLIVLEENVVS